MQLHRVIAMAMIITSVSAASNSTSNHNLNGWYPCTDYTFADGDTPVGPVPRNAQCAVYSAPLCYPGICETPEGVNPNVGIFVKRMLATKGNPSTATNVWLLQGGPGEPSTGMEVPMVTLHMELKGAVNVYAMDHRGTGRSTLFDCVAAQATTTGSPFGAEIDLSEVSACAKDLQIKYGDLASFSVTTAATDLATFISKFTNGRSTIVYGASYGTIFAERLMHLSPPEVTGYVLDSVAVTSGVPADEFFYMSSYDINTGEVGDAFLGLCEDDSSCKARFQPHGFKNTLQSLIEKFDNDPSSTCAALVNGTAGLDAASPPFDLRSLLGAALMDPNVRTLIPPVVYRLERCSPEDVDVLTQFLTTLFPKNKATLSQDSSFASTLLYSLIIYSEIWESPQPPMSEMKVRFINARSAGGVFETGEEYCVYSKEKSKSCDEINISTYDASGIIYKRDQYWNQTATIPSQASVLLMSGKLDPQTPSKYAESFFNVLDGEKKKLIAFGSATHATIYSTPMVTGDPSSATCGMKVLASYVRSAEDLERLDKSCVDEMPVFNLTTPDDYLSCYFGTTDAYDGMFNSSLISN